MDKTVFELLLSLSWGLSLAEKDVFDLREVLVELFDIYEMTQVVIFSKTEPSRINRSQNLMNTRNIVWYRLGRNQREDFLF